MANRVIDGIKRLERQDQIRPATMSSSTEALLVLLVALSFTSVSTSTSHPNDFTFPVPTNDCPPDYRETLFQHFNDRRVKDHLLPLTTSPIISSHANDYTKYLYVNDYNTIETYHGYNTRDNANWWPDLQKTVNLETKHIIRMLSENYWPPTQWANATQIGFGCATISYGRKNTTADYGTDIVLTMLSTDGFDFELPSNDCPPGYGEALLAAFNDKRTKEHLPLLALSSNLSNLALDYAKYVGNTKGNKLATFNSYPTVYNTKWIAGLTDAPSVHLKVPEILTLLTSGANNYIKEKNWKDAKAIGFACYGRISPKLSKDKQGGTNQVLTALVEAKKG